MTVYKLDLTLESAKSCRTKPVAKLALALSIMKNGDVLEVEGDEAYYPYRQVRDILVLSGLTIEREDYDGLTYRIIASKRGVSKSAPMP